MKSALVIVFVCGLGTGVCLMDMAHDWRRWKANQAPAERPVPVDTRLACAHWSAVGQGWRCL